MSDEQQRYGKSGDTVISQLRDLQGEFAQLSELDEMEHNYAQKLVDSFKLLQSVAENVIPLRSDAIGNKYGKVTKAFMAADCVVVMTDDEGDTKALPLARFRSNEILTIVQDATPHLKKIITEKKRATSERVEVLERILKELKKAGSTLKQTRQELQPLEEDLVSSSIASE